MFMICVIILPLFIMESPAFAAWIVFIFSIPLFFAFGRKLTIPHWLRVTLAILIAGGIFVAIILLAFG